jgi:8-oxo-dGTP pyrophosphatase MutT (NUDIX family)
MRSALRASLQAHRPADAREAEALRAILEFLSAEEDPFGRENPRGHVTGSAVVCDAAGSRFLLVRHVRLGRWLQPGGHTQRGDRSVLATAMREAREETGVHDLEAPLGEAVLHVDVHEIPARGAEPAHWHYDIRYLVTARAPATATGQWAGDGAEVSGVGWFDDGEVAALALDESLRRALRRAAAVLGAASASAVVVRRKRR